MLFFLQLVKFRSFPLRLRERMTPQSAIRTVLYRGLIQIILLTYEAPFKAKNTPAKCNSCLWVCIGYCSRHCNCVLWVAKCSFASLLKMQNDFLATFVKHCNSLPDSNFTIRCFLQVRRDVIKRSGSCCAHPWDSNPRLCVTIIEKPNESRPALIFYALPSTVEFRLNFTWLATSNQNALL